MFLQVDEEYIPDSISYKTK